MSNAWEERIRNYYSGYNCKNEYIEERITIATRKNIGADLGGLKNKLEDETFSLDEIKGMIERYISDNGEDKRAVLRDRVYDEVSNFMLINELIKAINK